MKPSGNAWARGEDTCLHTLHPLHDGAEGPAVPIVSVSSGLSQATTHYYICIMFEFTLCNVIGYAAAVCMVMGYMPQAIYTIRTRDTDGIALPTFLLMGLGGFFFFLQGILTDNLPLTITNLITTASSMIVFGIKVYNDFIKK